MKHGKINFSRDLILGKEELQRFRDFSENKLLDSLKARLGSGETRNIFTLGANDSFEVTKAVADNTVDVTTGNVVVLNKNPYVAEYKGDTDFALDSGFTPAASDVRYLGISATEVGYEIDATVSVTGTSLNDPSGNLSEIVRGIGNYDNTKIKFLKPGGTLVNTGLYDIVEIVGSTNITLSHDLTVETGLKPVIIGTYDLIKVAPTAELYTFTLLTLGVYEGASITDDILPIAKITWSGATSFTIDNDYRLSYDILPSYFEETAIDVVNSQPPNIEVFEKTIKSNQGLLLDNFLIRTPTDTFTLDVTGRIILPYNQDSDIKGSHFYVQADGAHNTIREIGINKGQLAVSSDIDGYDVILTNPSATPVVFEISSVPLQLEIGGLGKAWNITLQKDESIHLISHGISWHVLSFPQTEINLSTDWRTPNYGAGGFAASTTYSPLRYKKRINGEVVLQGALTGVAVLGEPSFTLAGGYRPDVKFETFCYNATNGSITRLEINTDGTSNGIVTVGGADEIIIDTQFTT